MRLAKSDKILKIWEYAFEQGGRVVLMRHAPKAGGDNSGLSEEGRQLAIKYGDILRPVWQSPVVIDCGLALACTGKKRTKETLKCMFSFSDESAYLKFSGEDKISSFVQNQVDNLHRQVGRFKGYLPNHTYYFLEKMGGQFGKKNLHTVIAERMAKDIRELFSLANFLNTVIYCGHSPAIEVGLEKLLGLSLSELGGFLNPLDSIHLRMNENKIEWVARINPIVDYVDLENETYF